MNKIIIKGRLIADPEIRTTTNGINVCNFTVAVNRRFDREKTDFIICEAWRQTAEFIKHYFHKGKEIALCGELHIDKWEKDGETKYMTKIVVDEVEFCGGKDDSAKTEKKSDPAEPLGIEEEFEELLEDGELPF